MKFKNIIFYKTTAPESRKFMESLKHIQYIRIFSPELVDEVQQIIDQSERAVILVDDEVSAAKLHGATLHRKKAEFRKYYLNWNMKIAPDFTLFLKTHNFGIINTEDEEEAVQRVELYLYGKADVFKNPNVDPGPYQKRELFKKAFFSLFELQGKSWKMLATSHEPEDAIDQILNFDWRDYLAKILREASHMKEGFDRRIPTSPYHEIIFPHFSEGKIKKLSVVHVAVDSDYATNILRIQQFLSEIKA